MNRWGNKLIYKELVDTLEMDMISLTTIQLWLRKYKTVIFHVSMMKRLVGFTANLPRALAVPRTFLIRFCPGNEKPLLSATIDNRKILDRELGMKKFSR
jgi:hypothetical protein